MLFECSKYIYILSFKFSYFLQIFFNPKARAEIILIRITFSNFGAFPPGCVVLHVTRNWTSTAKSVKYSQPLSAFKRPHQCSGTAARRQRKLAKQHLIRAKSCFPLEPGGKHSDGLPCRPFPPCPSHPSCPAWHCLLHMAVWPTRCLGKHTWRLNRSLSVLSLWQTHMHIWLHRSSVHRRRPHLFLLR